MTAGRQPGGNYPDSPAATLRSIEVCPLRGPEDGGHHGEYFPAFDQDEDVDGIEPAALDIGPDDRGLTSEAVPVLAGETRSLFLHRSLSELGEWAVSESVHSRRTQRSARESATARSTAAESVAVPRWIKISFTGLVACVCLLVCLLFQHLAGAGRQGHDGAIFDTADSRRPARRASRRVASFFPVDTGTNLSSWAVQRVNELRAHEAPRPVPERTLVRVSLPRDGSHNGSHSHNASGARGRRRDPRPPSAFIGHFVSASYAHEKRNAWHYVTITRAGEGRLLWGNQEGVQWHLHATSDTDEWDSGHDCPYQFYYKTRFEFNDDGRLLRVYGPFGEPYEAAGPNFLPRSLMECGPKAELPIARTECMTAQDYDMVAASIRALLTRLPTYCDEERCPQADFAGCILRMVGHDYMDYRGGGLGGLDGCVDMSDPINNGLAVCLARGVSAGGVSATLAEAYQEFCDRISLADFLVVAAESLMTSLRPSLPEQRSLDFKYGFRFGRLTRDGRSNEMRCNNTGATLPDPEGSCDEVRRVLVDGMGLNVSEAAALIGMHTVGRAQRDNSGYEGYWSNARSTGPRFTNDYYVSLLTKGWMPKAQVGGNPQKNVWARSDIRGLAEVYRPNPGGHELMLNTDLCLAYSGGPHREGLRASDSPCCAWIGLEMQGNWSTMSYMHCGAPGSKLVEERRAASCAGFGKQRRSADIDCRPQVDECSDSSTDDSWHVKDWWKPQAIMTTASRSLRRVQHTKSAASFAPDGFAGSDVLAFANNEQVWLETFQKAWEKATQLGPSNLVPLQEVCSTIALA